MGLIFLPTLIFSAWFDTNSVYFGNGFLVQTGVLTFPYTLSTSGIVGSSNALTATVNGISTVVNADSDGSNFLVTHGAVQTYLQSAIDTEYEYYAGDQHLRKDELLGAILPFAVPSGSNVLGSKWIECDGRALDPASYPDLYAKIGTTFGQSGALFKVPDLRGRVPVGATSTIADNAIGGSETVMLAETNLPSHSHGVIDPGHTHSILQYNVSLKEGSSHFAYQFFDDDHGHTTLVSPTPQVIQSSSAGLQVSSFSPPGGQQAVNVMKPFISLRYFIRATL
jgi:microcystin-dependent protein